ISTIYGGTPTVTYSVVQGNYSGGVYPGTGNRNTTPVLGTLQNNGGFTQTISLGASSSAIDTGTNTGCPDTDQHGVTRPQDGNDDGSAICDIGAYEVP
ncbi:MAG TPA: choice-of-anchor Q domain-containing protein, partial [Anaerolineales bacterium]|nr:choice-of-anchor Q domain-containing protein [Anaerolineales bacterium]